MARFIKSKKQAIGVAPDTLIFRGEQKLEKVRLRLIQFNATELGEYEEQNLQQLSEHFIPGHMQWINIDGLHDENCMEDVSHLLNIDKVIMSDVLNTHARPKLSEHDNCLYVSLKMPQYNEEEKILRTENIVLILQNNRLITFQERVGDMFNPVRERIRNSKKRIRTLDSDYLAFTLMDVIIDTYIYAISDIGLQIETLDDEIQTSSSDEIIHAINKYKREINYLRKVIKPLRELVLAMVKLDSDYLSDETLTYYKELENNINLANDSLDSYREILSDQFNVYQSIISNSLNQVLKVLTLFSVIFIPITFIAGIYGTNFTYIPELQFRYGYFAMWAVIMFVVIGMLVFFKRKKWL